MYVYIYVYISGWRTESCYHCFECHQLPVPEEMRTELEEQLAMTLAGFKMLPTKKRPMWWVNQFRIFQFVQHGSSWILDAWVSSGFGTILMILNLKSKMVDHHFALKALTILGHRRFCSWRRPCRHGPKFGHLVQGTCGLWKSWASETTRPWIGSEMFIDENP